MINRLDQFDFGMDNTHVVISIIKSEDFDVEDILVDLIEELEISGYVSNIVREGESNTKIEIGMDLLPGFEVEDVLDLIDEFMDGVEDGYNGFNDGSELEINTSALTVTELLDKIFKPGNPKPEISKLGKQSKIKVGHPEDLDYIFGMNINPSMVKKHFLSRLEALQKDYLDLSIRIIALEDYFDPGDSETGLNTSLESEIDSLVSDRDKVAYQMKTLEVELKKVMDYIENQPY